MYNLQPQKKNSPLVTILAIIGGITVFVVAGMFLINLAVFGSPLDSGATHLVTYTITSFGCIDYSVTYAIPNGSSQKDVTACNGTNPVYTFNGSRGDYLYLSVQNSGPSRNDRMFTCEINVDNRQIVQVTAQGFANIASCSGSIQ